MPVSNPCSFYTTSWSAKGFEYEGGSKLYHFSAHNAGMTTHHGINLIFSANSQEHAFDVFKRMLQFARDCAIKYGSSRAMDSVQDNISFHKRMELEVAKIDNMAKELKPWMMVETPNTQFFTVGWASNDTIHF